MQSTVSVTDKAGQIRAENGPLLTLKEVTRNLKQCSFREAEIQKPVWGGFRNEWDEKNLETASMDTSLRNSVNPLSSYFSLSYCESLLLLRMKKGRKKKSRKMEGGGRRQRKVLNVPGTSYTLSQLILTLYNNPIK